MEPSAEESDVRSESRVKTLTEKGSQRYEELKNEHLSRIEKTWKHIDTESRLIDENKNNLKSLQEIENSLAVYTARYSTLADSFVNFLKRNNTEESRNEETKFGIKDNDYRLLMDDAVRKIRDYVSTLLDEDGHSCISSKHSLISKCNIQRSNISSMSSIIARKKAKAGAARAQVQFADQEAEIKRQQASIDHQRANLDVELDLLAQRRKAAVAEAEVAALQQTEDNEMGSTRQSITTPLPHIDKKTHTKQYIEQHASFHDIGFVDPEPEPQYTSNHLQTHQRSSNIHVAVPDPVTSSLNPRTPA